RARRACSSPERYSGERSRACSSPAGSRGSSTSPSPPASSSRQSRTDRWRRGWACRAPGIVNVGGKEIPVGGDIILSVEDIPDDPEDHIEQIRNRLAGIQPGATFKMSVLRAGKVVELTGSAE